MWDGSIWDVEHWAVRLIPVEGRYGGRVDRVSGWALGFARKRSPTPCRAEAEARKTLASCEACNSLRRESRASDISGLIDANVRNRSSVPYLCLTKRGSSGWMRRSQISTIKFSSVGEISSSSEIFSPWCVREQSLVNKLSSMKDWIRWNKSSGRSLWSRCMSDRSRKRAPDVWKPKCNRIICQILSIEVELLIMELREITGQKFAICPNIRSNNATFCCAVLRWGSGTVSASSVNPRRGFVRFFSFQVDPSTRNGAKLGSRARVYCRFWRQLSKLLTVSFLVKTHCFGALCESAMAGDAFACLHSLHSVCLPTGCDHRRYGINWPPQTAWDEDPGRCHHANIKVTVITVCRYHQNQQT